MPEDADGTGGGGAGGDDALPESVLEEALRLTRLARRAPEDPPEPGHEGAGGPSLSDAEQYRTARAELLAEHGFRARVREDDDGATLVCHPRAWLVDGEVDLAAVEDVDRAVERRLDGTGDERAYDEVAAHNRAVAERVAVRHGPTHGATADAFATFMSNHRLRRVETATAGDVLEFVGEYFPRNAWPDEAQRAVVNRSVRHVLAAARDG